LKRRNRKKDETGGEETGRKDVRLAGILGFELWH